MNLTAARRLEAVPTLDLPVGYDLEALHVADGSHEVLHVSCGTTPTLTDGRQIHRSRDARRNVVLVVAIESPRGVHLVGPNPEGAMAGPLPVDQAQRILQAGLDETTALAARRRLTHLLAAVETNDDLAGVTNAGLFATHYLATSARERDDWTNRTEAARPMLDMRSSDLVAALGYTSEGLGAGALLLSTNTGPVHAVAVLMTEREGFDAATDRFGSSPVQYGLAKAHQERVPWLIVLRGAQIRLYPVRPDAGVGRRSQAETYLELDLSVVDDRTAGFLPLVFAAGALEDDGTVQELLDGSVRYAAALGERLRDRVYTHVVPNLAVAVATDLERLGHGDDLDGAYRITLKVLFRLLFQAYAEDQGLLPYNRNDRYTRNSLTTQANDFVERPDRELDAESHAIWSDLRQVWDVIDTGNKDWDVPAYNGGLFGQDADLHPDGHLIDQMRLDDHSVGTALRYLLTDDTGDGELGAVDFRSLSVREFGTIYEGLLESSLSRAETDLALDKNDAYIPTDDPDKTVVHAGAIYHHNASGERKATGSYFTKPFAVEHLLERALDPTLTEHLDQVQALLDDDKPADAAEKFFDFRVADLAMGSGHFLIAAIDRMEVQMAAFLTDHPIPAISQELDRLEAAARTALGDSAGDYEIEPSALLRRQIARRCIYGLDINEIAVELARVAVWIHTFVPGLPMSSLDHTLVCGNSLTGIGTIDEAIDALEPKRKKGTPSFFLLEIEQALEEARALLVDAANSMEADRREVKAAAEAAHKAAEAAAPTRLLFDAAIALRLGEIETLPADVSEIRSIAAASHVQERLDDLQPVHLPFRFPEVFLRAAGGFDVVLGNPPWEKLMIMRNRWWSLRFPGLLGLPMKDREGRIAELEDEYPALLRQLEEEEESYEGIRTAIALGPYPKIGTGHVDLYKAFGWRNWQVLRPGGRVGVVLPRAALAAAGTAEWRKAVIATGSFEDVCFLVNTGGWVFDQVHQQFSVALVVTARTPDRSVQFCGPFHNIDEFYKGRADKTVVPVSEFQTWSDSLTFPRLPDAQCGSILRKMKLAPRFDSEGDFAFRLVQGDLNPTSERKVFEVGDPQGKAVMPVLTGATFHLWNLEFGTPYGHADPEVLLPYLRAKINKAAKSKSSAFAGLHLEREDDLPTGRARIMYRKITNATDSRSGIFCLAPPGVALVDPADYLLRRTGTERDEAYILGVLCSFPFDWYVRRWVELNFNFFLFNPMPIPRPSLVDPRRQRVVELAGRLAAVDERFNDWAEEVGVATGSLKDPREREGAKAELDALAALLYGLTWREVAHIFDTFHRSTDYADHLAAVRVHYDRWSIEA